MRCEHDDKSVFECFYRVGEQECDRGDVMWLHCYDFRKNCSCSLLNRLFFPILLAEKLKRLAGYVLVIANKTT